MAKQPDALVTVHLLPSDQGGRLGPTPADSFGCIMSIDGVNLDVRFRLDGREPLRPGITRDVAVDFLNPEFAKRHVTMGEAFQLRESKVIGSGTVKQVLLHRQRHRLRA